MKKFEQYGQRKEGEWEWFPWFPWWPPETRPPFKISTKSEDITPFFFVDHHPYALSLLLKISDGFKADTFRKLGLEGSSKDWETLVTGFIAEWEEENSGVDMFHFDSDEDIFCVYSQYIDDISLFSRLLRAACNDEERIRYYFNRGFQEFKTREELKALHPFENGHWSKDALEEYLIHSCNVRFSREIDGFLAEHQGDEALAELLFSFLLDDRYDGSDCQIGAAYYIARMEQDVLRKKKDLLLRAQRNEVVLKRPFRDGKNLEWLTLTE